MATWGDAAGLVNVSILEAVGPEGVIVNIKRGAVVDEDELIAALKEGGSAAPRSTSSPRNDPGDRWRQVPNVILTPHVAGVNHAASARLRGPRSAT